MRRPEIKSVTLTPNPIEVGGKLKIVVEVEDNVIPTEEPQMYSLPFTLGDNQGGGF